MMFLDRVALHMLICVAGSATGLQAVAYLRLFTSINAVLRRNWRAKPLTFFLLVATHCNVLGAHYW